MKEYLIRALNYVLKQLARLTIWRYRPGIVAVTGSAGKTSTKLAVAAVISAERTVRVSYGNFNSSFGVPLAILGDWPAHELELFGLDEPPGAKRLSKTLFLLKVVWRSLVNIVVTAPYPDILVLEYGIDHPGDMKELIAIARPNVSILTAIGDPPVHVEFFESAEAVAREKSRLIECLTAADFAVLNADSGPVMRLKERTRARTVTYGFGQNADVRIADMSHIVQNSRPAGVRFALVYAGVTVPVELPNVLGASYPLAAAAGAAVGLIFGMKLPKVVQALQAFKPAPSRMELLNGQKDTLILNDAFNASPLSVELALRTLSDLPAKRKVAVLGDMRELGAYSIAAHEDIGRKAAETVNVLMTVGREAKLIAEAARKAGLRKNMVSSYETVDEALLPVQDLLRKGDLILVKGSHGVHLENLVEQIKKVG